MSFRRSGRSSSRIWIGIGSGILDSKRHGSWAIYFALWKKLTVIALRSCCMGLGTRSALFDLVQQHSKGGFIPKPHLSVHLLAFVKMLIKAHRFCSGKDIYRPASHILKTITREEKTHRVRDIKPGEVVESIWDQITNPQAKFMFTDTNNELQSEAHQYLLYNESDVLEDAVLFPEESQKAANAMIPHQSTQAMHTFEHEGPSIVKFIFDLDTDDEVDGEADNAPGHDSGKEHLDSTDEYSTEAPDNGHDRMKVGRDAQILELIARAGPDNLPATMERMQAFLTSKTSRKPGEGLSDGFELFMDKERASGKCNFRSPQGGRSRMSGMYC